MKYYLEVLHSIDDKDKNGLIITKKEFSTKEEAMIALEKKEINSNQKKRLHLCTHNELKNNPCEIIN